MTAFGPLHESLPSPRAGPRFTASFKLFPHPPAHTPASVALQQYGPCMWVINSNVSRKEQIRVIKASAASRLQNRSPAFKQAAEPDAFGASFHPIYGADAFSSSNGRTAPPPLEEGSPPKESVFTSKLEEILNKFRTREKRSSSADEPDAVGRRKEASPSSLQQSETIALQRDFLRERRLGMAKGNAGGGFYTTENATSNPADTSTPLPWVRSPATKIQTSVRKGSRDFAGARGVTKSSQSTSHFGNKRRSVNSDPRKDGHWSTSVEKTSEAGKGSKPFSRSPRERKLEAEEDVALDFDWSDSDEEDKSDTVASVPANDGARASPSKEAYQPSSGSSRRAPTGDPKPLMNGNIAAWHSHSIPNLPFEFQYSYSETPKEPIIRYREEPYSPFGPDTMGRPWTGGPPLKKSKKNLPQFDSFKPPPVKKGIKFVQNPGPFPQGQGPKPARSREEIHGKPLSGEEIVELVDSCRSERRQLNLGRDGLTHNMLDLIHCHWKRRRVLRIRCIGVPTLDMDNVCFHLEDKTGGKIIYRSGGSVYLFRGRNYNYKDRPIIPIMLWKPISPVYPKLIKRAPEGLTAEEADKLRMLGQKIEPLCTLAKNGVYLSLVKDVRAAFRVDDLVRINCRGLNPSDYKKIGAKLKVLVPCVLLSFDNEQILMWKGTSTVSVNVDADTSNRIEDFEAEAVNPLVACGGGDECNSAVEKIKQQALVVDTTGAATLRSDSNSAEVEGWPSNLTATGGIDEIKDDNSNSKDLRGREFLARNGPDSSLQTVLNEDAIKSDKANATPAYRMPHVIPLDSMPGHERECHPAFDSQLSEPGSFMESSLLANDQVDEHMVSKANTKLDENSAQLEISKDAGTGMECLNDARVIRVDALWDHAIASGMAIQLEEIDTDSDVVAKKAKELDKTVPAAAEYTPKLQKKLWIRTKRSPRPDGDLRIHFANLYKAKAEKKAAKKAVRFRRPVDVPDNGGLPVEELARLLSIK